jgi:hypothetical protein
MKKRKVLETGCFLRTPFCKLILCLIAVPSIAIQFSEKPIGAIQYYGLWTVGGNYSSTLLLRNPGTQSYVAQVLAFGPDGTQEGIADLTVSANTVSRLSIGSILHGATGPERTGGLVVSFQPGMLLTGEIQLLNSGNGASFETALWTGEASSVNSSLFAPWWLPSGGADGVVELFNSSVETISVHPSTIAAGVNHPSGNVVLAPHQTVELALRTLIENAAADIRLGTVALHYVGPQGALVARLLITDNSSSFVSVLDFQGGESSDAGAQVGVQFPNVQLSRGIVPQNSPEKLNLYALLGNNTNRPITLDMFAYGVRDGGSARKIRLRTEVIAPFETRILELSPLLDPKLTERVSRLALAASFFGAQGDLRVAIFCQSPGDGTVYQAESGLLPSETLDVDFWDMRRGLGGLPVIKNETSEPVQAHLTIHYSSLGEVSEYIFAPIPVPALGSQKVDLRQVLLSGMPDAAGNKIPSGVESGTVILSANGPPLDDLNGKYRGCSPTCNVAGVTSLTGMTLQGTRTAQHFLPENCPKAVLDSISPDYGAMGTTVPVTITGSNFLGGLDIEVYVSGGITATVDSYTDTEIYATFAIPIGGAPGVQTVFASNEWGDSNSIDFEDGDPTPVIKTVSPDTWNAGTVTDFTITGTGFGSNPTLEVTGTYVTGSSIISHSDNGVTATIDASVTISPLAPAGSTATIQVKSNGYNGNGFQGEQQGDSSQSNQKTATIIPIPAPVPTIKYFGHSTTAQSVVVGQEISLAASVNVPSGLSITNQAWTIPGTVVGTYTANTSGATETPIGALTNSTIKYYWVSTNNSSLVKYQYWLDNNETNSATVNFTVDEPTGVGVTISPGTVVIKNPGAPGVTIVELATTGPGMKFLAGANHLPAGAYQWVQLISSDLTQSLGPSGPNQPVQWISGAPELDNTYPYGNGTGTVTTTYVTNDTAADSPFSPVGALGGGEYARTFKATMYLEWLPNPDNLCTDGGACTIPITQGTIAWQYSGDGIDTLQPQQNNTYMLWVLSNCQVNPFSPNGFASSGSFPIWSAAYDNNGD